jgi:hypothetical protein
MAKGWRKTGKQWKTVGKTIGKTVENQRKLGERLEKMENDVNGVCGNHGERLSMVLHALK